MISLQNIHKTYEVNGKTITALNNIHLTIEQGTIFGILGKSGAGKSTLLRCINLLERPSQGEVWVNGVNLTTLSSKALREERRNIGMIFQHFNLLSSRTVFDNVAFPLELEGLSKEEIKKRVYELLEKVSLLSQEHHLPSQLSGGQKQRVAIARALATQPRVLLCDEATSALDPHSTHAILDLLKTLHKEFPLTIVLITHELDVVKRICHEAAIIHEGEIQEAGKVLDIFTNPSSTIAKDLIKRAFHLELPENIRESLKSNLSENEYSQILQLTYVGKDADKPIITTLIKEFDVSFNILLADLEYIENSPVGFTVCQLTGKREAVEKALSYLDSLSIKVELINL